MKYEQKSFQVAMPGNEARQWPKCGHEYESTVFRIMGKPETTTYICALDFGHDGEHGAPHASGWAYWPRTSTVWKDGKRVAA